MKKQLLLVLTTMCLSRAIAQDTTIVQTLTYDSAGRNYMFTFPEDTGQSYQQIIMEYSMRCKDGLVSTSNDRNKGCGEWDYSCNTYITDSTYTDSLKAIHPSHIISGFNGTAYDFTASPTYAYYRYTQKNVQINSIISEDTITYATTSDTSQHPFDAGNVSSKSIYVWSAAELSAAGVTAGNIHGLRMDVLSVGSALKHLKIQFKHTTQSTLDAANVDNNGFTTVYYAHTQLQAGHNYMRFYTPFNWNGTSNVLVKFSFTNSDTGTDNVVLSDDYAASVGLITASTDAYIEFTGSEHIDLGNSTLSAISDEITISFWSYGDPEKMPVNNSVFEGVDNSNRRQVNVHLPWSNSRVYWDCGSDGNYDRIDNAALTGEFEGQWNHWAFTKNAASGEMKAYLNGSLWHSGTGKNKLIDLMSLTIGSAINGTNHYAGNVDEFRVWKKELSQTEIADWMSQNIDATHPQYAHLVALYSLNENTGSTVVDGSIAGETGQVSGVPHWKIYRGDAIFKGFSETTVRPNVAFLQGNYNLTVTDTLVWDTIQNAATSVIEYALSGTDVVPIDTQYVWDAGYEYAYNANGIKIDSFAITGTSTITITDLDYYAKYPGRFEIMSFVTPYGIGLNFGLDGHTWQFDVTDFKPILNGKKRLSMEAGGQFQEEIDIRFLMISGIPPRDVINIQQLWKVESQNYANILSDARFEPRNVTLDASAAAYKLRTAVTGHGQDGEFVPRIHYINVDGGTKEFEWEVWKECADNPIYPQGGTWIFDRAGWCPGAPTDVQEFMLDVTPGQTIVLDYGINFVGGQSNYIVNNQLVTYGAINHQLDANIMEVKRPSKRVEFARINPACQEPIVVIQNTGADTLTSLTIEYGVEGNTMETYQWTGNLGFLESAEVTLPVSDISFWTFDSVTSNFVVTISAPNGATDGNSGNNTLTSAFETPKRIDGPIIVEFLTNLRPDENSYTVKDMYGNVVLDRYGLSYNTLYRDELELVPGCYSLEVLDEEVGSYGQNGLYFWFQSNFGNGSVELRDTSNASVQDFNSDFGSFIHYDFYSMRDTSASSINSDLGYKLVTVYPNPTTGNVNYEVHGANSDLSISLRNEIGQLVLQQNVGRAEIIKNQLDITAFPEGIYFLHITGDNINKTQKITKL